MGVRALVETSNFFLKLRDSHLLHHIYKRSAEFLNTKVAIFQILIQNQKNSYLINIILLNFYVIFVMEQKKTKQTLKKTLLIKISFIYYFYI